VTPRPVAVAEAFGLGIHQEKTFVIYDNVELKIGFRDVVLITGDSGSGKSVLLKALAQDIVENHELGTIVNNATIQIELDKPLVETLGQS